MGVFAALSFFFFLFLSSTYAGRQSKVEYFSSGGTGAVNSSTYTGNSTHVAGGQSKDADTSRMYETFSILVVEDGLPRYIAIKLFNTHNEVTGVDIAYVDTEKWFPMLRLGTDGGWVTDRFYDAYPNISTGGIKALKFVLNFPRERGAIIDYALPNDIGTGALYDTKAFIHE